MLTSSLHTTDDSVLPGKIVFSFNLCVRCDKGVGSIKQKETLHWSILCLKLRAHFKSHTGTKGVASDAIRSLRLNLSDALDVVGCQGVDTVQRSSWRWEGWRSGRLMYTHFITLQCGKGQQTKGDGGRQEHLEQSVVNKVLVDNLCFIYNKQFATFLSFNRGVRIQNTFCALQAKAGHAELGSKRLEGSNRALYGMNQEQRLLLALNMVEWCRSGTIRVD